MVLTDTGAKLPKSLSRDGKVPPPGAHPWMLDITAWEGDVDSYVDAMVWLVAKMLADPTHFYRSYTTQELDRIMTACPAVTTGVRARAVRSMPLTFAAGAAVGVLGGMIDLGGAEFRLPLLIGLFGFAALAAVIMNKAMSLVVVLIALPARLGTVSLAELGAHWTVAVNLLMTAPPPHSASPEACC
ncbi:hypothetical protein Aros01_08524 [Streptosporangium roseum]|uniref:hypothetical protein n=1 Tax=Streptosporangium roseum TaxID=2001 RepID=UPI0030A86A3C